MANTARLFPLETFDTPKPSRPVRPRPRLVPDAPAAPRMGAFSPLEEDFFARAADLYPPPADELEEWDRLLAMVKIGL
jgi:hypothetical protein